MIPPPVNPEGPEVRIPAFISEGLRDDLDAIAALEGRSRNVLVQWFLGRARDEYKKERGLSDLVAAAKKTGRLGKRFRASPKR